MGAEVQPFERFMAAVTAYTAAAVALSPEQKAQLGGDLPRDVVKTREQGGKNLRYVEGWYVIDRLNQVFGYDGWSFEAGAITVSAVGDKSVVYVPVTLRACGTTRGDVGAAVTAGKGADALETALKAAVTDGLKRAARTFGTTLGNRLYDKLGSGIGVSTKAEAMLAEIDDATSAADVNAWVKANKEAVAKLATDEQDIIKGACARRRRELATDATEPPAQPATESEARTAQQPTSAAQPTRPVDARPSALDAYRARCAAAPTLDQLVATHLELAPTVAQSIDEAKTVVRIALTRLNVTAEAFGKALGEASSITREPGHWSVVGKVLADVRAAQTKEAVAQLVRAHGAAATQLPAALKDRLNAARIERLHALEAPASLHLAAQIEDEIRRAASIADLETVHAKLTKAIEEKALTPEQSKELARQYNDAAESVERAQGAQAA